MNIGYENKNILSVFLYLIKNKELNIYQCYPYQIRENIEEPKSLL